MMTQEIHSEDWPEFCRRFNEMSRGSLMTIEAIDPLRGNVDVATDAPLREFRLDETDACNHHLELEVGGDGRKVTCHSMREPFSIRLKESDGGAKMLQIDAESGVTLVTFHSGRWADVLEGLPSSRRRVEMA